MKTRSSLDTRQQILDVAERHFALHGFAGTSLRGIIKDAKVNIAAVAYHFGTKEDLFDAVVERFAAPVVSEQLRQLSSVQDKSNLSQIIAAFYVPPLKLIKARGQGGRVLGLFLGRMQTEPEPVFSKVDQHFARCRTQFVEAFGVSLPDASEADLHWYFEFMLSLIVAFLTREEHVRKRYGDKKEWMPEETAERMIRFCLTGMHV